MKESPSGEHSPEDLPPESPRSNIDERDNRDAAYSQDDEDANYADDADSEAYPPPNSMKPKIDSILCDMSRTRLSRFPEEVLEGTTLKMLCLSDTELEILPEDLFQRLTNLAWLDVRNNRLQQLCSAGLAQHQHLNTLLLGNNLITHLPLELGAVETLRNLNLAVNPLVFPPEQIISGGINAIKSYLIQKAAGGGPEDSFISEGDTFDLGQSLGHDNTNASLPHLHANKEQSGVVNRPYKNEKLLNKSLLKAQANKSAKAPPPKKASSLYPATDSDHLPSIESMEKRAMAERRAKKAQLVKIQTDEILQKVKDDESRRKWRQETKALQMKKSMQRANMSVSAINRESESRIQRAPFDINKQNLGVMSGPELDYVKRLNIPEEEKPAPLTFEEKLEREAIRREEELQLVNGVKRHAEAVRARKFELSQEPGYLDTEAIQRELQIAEELQREIAMRRKALDNNLTMYK